MHLSRFAITLAALLPLLSAQDQKPLQEPLQEPLQKLLEEGKKLALAHEWSAALVKLEAAVVLAPDDVEALRWRGHAYTGSEQYEKAFADLDRAVELFANDSWTQYARAMSLHHLGRYEEAVDGYTMAHALDAKFSKPVEWRGFTLSLLGKHVAALADIRLAIKMNRGNSWLWFIRGKTFVALLDFELAAEDFWRVVDAEESNADAHAQLGYLSACTGDKITAKNMLRRAVKLAPESQSEARTWLYHLYVARGERKAATAQLDAIFVEQAKEGADKKALRWPAQIAEHLQGKLGAAELIGLAEKESPEEGELRGRQCEAWLHVGMLHLEGKRRSEAMLALAQAVATDARSKWEWSLARRMLTEICYPDDE